MEPVPQRFIHRTTTLNVSAYIGSRRAIFDSCLPLVIDDPYLVLLRAGRREHSGTVVLQETVFDIWKFRFCLYLAERADALEKFLCRRGPVWGTFSEWDASESAFYGPILGETFVKQERMTGVSVVEAGAAAQKKTIQRRCGTLLKLVVDWRAARCAGWLSLPSLKRANSVQFLRGTELP